MSKTTKVTMQHGKDAFWLCVYSEKRNEYFNFPVEVTEINDSRTGTPRFTVETSSFIKNLKQFINEGLEGLE